MWANGPAHRLAHADCELNHARPRKVRRAMSHSSCRIPIDSVGRSELHRMSSSAASSTRLTRLLDFIEHTGGNLALRKDAIGEPCNTGHWQIARELIVA